MKRRDRKMAHRQDTLAYDHHDHLGTPIQATDAAGNVVWSARYEAFGRARITTLHATADKPTITNNLRLPGQYEDAETGLHYNFMRYYDPDTGRYITSDPIGLEGGVNTYVYVEGDPLSKVDPTGEFGLPGAAGAAAFNFFTQFGTNLYLSSGDWRRALRCVDLGDVLISGALGFVGPSFISNVLGGKAGPAGLTTAQNRYLYFTKSLPVGFSLKKGSPPLRVADDCECQGLNLGAILSAVAH